MTISTTSGHATSSTHTLFFPQLDRRITARPDETILKSARRAGVRIVGACGGRGTCGSCLVQVVEGRVRGAPGNEALVGGRGRQLKRGVRACQATPLSDCVLEIAARSLAPVVRTDVADAFATDQVRPRAAAAGNKRTLGLAVDLGTTNTAAFLIDLGDGTPLASLGLENPQVAWGADFISRINHAVRDPQAAADLREAAVAGINALAHDLSRAVGADATDIVDVALCGNTAMQHLFMGLPVHQLARAPFVAAIRDATDVLARDLGVDVRAGAYVHVAASVGGFVGGDHVAALLATESRWRSEGASVVMDIGTNTEVSVIESGRILSASCPSGPALEGGNISCGMRAAEGAIEHVRLGPNGLELQVIGDVEPVGVCGSGVLDALATLYRAGIVDARGRIGGSHPAVMEVGGRRLVQLATGVALSQDDIRATQLAKAAIRTGIELLLARAGLTAQDLKRVIIAGAFGAYIDVTSAITIGLLPSLPVDRFEQVGNAAGAGIRRMLTSQAERDRARALASRCEHVELNLLDGFQKTYLSQLGLPPLLELKGTA